MPSLVTSMVAAVTRWRRPPRELYGADDVDIDPPEGARPQLQDYEKASATAGIPSEWLRAICHVESLELAMSSIRRPTLWFDIRMWPLVAPPAAKMALARFPCLNADSQVLRWGNFTDLRAVDADAAIRAALWGCARIPGVYHDLCGYQQPDLFLEAMSRSPGAQVLALARFLDHPRNREIKLAIAAGDCEAFAHHYYGAGWRRRGYALRIAESLRRFANA